MHEMSLATEVLAIIEDAARQQSFTRVKTIWLEIGQFSCVEIEALRFCFDSITQHSHSLAHGAQLEIIRLPGDGWCHICQNKVSLTTVYDACPRCGSYGIAVTGGDSLRIKELEVE
ncbi:MAG TPA: hydrogenase maturation nickel metallochaperone HypA [Nitrosomonas halophila]|nr:hydrogenase maturation nickel metallochaperone HypA [Nitrosomonas halophila]